MAKRGRPKKAVVRDDGKRYSSMTAAAKANYGYAGGRTAISHAAKTGGKAAGHKWHVSK